MVTINNVHDDVNNSNYSKALINLELVRKEISRAEYLKMKEYILVKLGNNSKLIMFYGDLYTNEPSYSNAVGLANLYFKDNKYLESVRMFIKANESAETRKQKAEGYMMAYIVNFFGPNKTSDCKDYLKKAFEFDSKASLKIYRVFFNSKIMDNPDIDSNVKANLIQKAMAIEEMYLELDNKLKGLVLIKNEKVREG